MLSKINICLTYNNNNNNNNNNDNDKIVNFIIFLNFTIVRCINITSPLINIIFLLPKFLLKVCYFFKY